MAEYIGKVQIGANGDLLPIGSTLYGTATWDSTNNRYNANSGNLANIEALLDGLTVHIKFSGYNIHTSPTLKVGSFDAKPIHRTAGTAVGITVETSWPDNAIVTFTYDGTAWVINSATDNNTTYTFTEGTTDGAFNVSVNGGAATPINIHGLGSAAYTSATDYATSAQGTKADNAMPISGGKFTGNVSFDSGTTLTVNSPTADDHAANRKYVDDSFSNAIGVATSAMIFKGTIGTGSGATIASLPTTGYVAGWTYRVVGSYTFGTSPNTIACEDGDIIIAVTSNSNTNASVVASDWTVAQANIDGAVITTGGTNGYIAKFTGNNTIANLAEITNNGTGFLKQDGTWATPTDTRDPGYGQVTVAAKSTAVAGLTEPSSAVTVSAVNPNEILKVTPANKWITITGSDSSTAGSDEIKFAHLVPSSITNSGPTAAQTGARGSTFNIPKITVDEAGHVTEITAITVSLPASDNTDEKVKQSPYSTSTDYDFDILFKKTNDHAEETNGVNFSTVTNKTLSFNPSTGTLKAAIFKGALDSSVLGTDDSITTALTFYHKSGAWKTLSINNTTTTIASVSNGTLHLVSSVNDNAVLTMTTPS